MDLSLQVGGSTDVVEVTGAPPVIDTTSTQLGAVMTDRSVRELPLSTRNTYELLQLQPGVQSPTKTVPGLVRDRRVFAGVSTLAEAGPWF